MKRANNTLPVCAPKWNHYKVGLGMLRINSNNALIWYLSILILLTITGDDIVNLDGLENLYVVRGNLYITSNTVLANLNGLANLVSVWQQLVIEFNPALTSLDGLGNLTSVGTELWITHNVMTDLSGLANLTQVGSMNINQNALLTNVDGLTGLTSVGEDLKIRNNNDLGSCSAMAPLLGWPSGPPNDTIGRDISIDSNAGGCNSIAEILDSTYPTAPVITTSEAINGRVVLSFSPAITTPDAYWPITGYQARCVSDDQFQDTFIANSATSPITLTGLTDSQRYLCSVSAFTDLGIGPASASVSVTPISDVTFADGFEDGA